MTAKTLSPQQRGDEIAFVQSECVRIQKLISKAVAGKKFKDLEKYDTLYSLPHPGGSGEAVCGKAAYNRLYKVASQALRESPLAGRAELADVFKALKEYVSERFLSGQQAITPDNVATAIVDALAVASEKCRDRTHFVPCRLMYAKDPDEFTIGPVTFRVNTKTSVALEGAFATYVADPKNDVEKMWLPKHLEEARSYYDAFTWCAEVKVLGCAPEVSKNRAFIAVEASVNVVRLLFGHDHTDRMTVGGPRLAQDRRAHMHITDEGKFDVSTSSDSTSAVTFGGNWAKRFEREDVQFMMDGAAKMLAPTVDPSLQRPLSARLVDALKWYGEAVREEPSASRIVKAVTAIERLVMTGDKYKITDKVAKRSAMLLCGTGLEKDFYKAVERMKHFYDLRSGLAHGRLSPFDPVVEEYAPACVRFAERVLSSGLVFLHSYNLLHQALTIEQLGQGYTTIVEQMEKTIAAGGSPSQTASTS